MSAPLRVQRLQQLIKETVSRTVLMDLHDPRLGFVTITKVKLARDLSFATVFYSVLGHEGEKKRTAEALDAARGILQRNVADAMGTRVTPKLEFRYDQSVEGMIRVQKILDEVGEEAAKREAAAGEAPPQAPESGNGDEDDDSVEDRHRGT